MASLNKVFLMGNLTRDVDLKYIPSGKAVANFGLAVNRTYTDANGDKVEDPCFVDIVAWDRLAEVCGDYLAKGRPVFIEGRLQMDSWESEDGQRKTKLKVVAQNIQFLGGKAGSETTSHEEGDDGVPF
ncbi:single-stranded DNA-binding protein [Candidatus Gottesmanbacteria bacterium]|nr:single-stranded DNA-binding protein [Candidatus Gottesmanbacteria bacterium]